MSNMKNTSDIPASVSVMLTPEQISTMLDAWCICTEPFGALNGPATAVLDWLQPIYKRLTARGATLRVEFAADRADLPKPKRATAKRA